MAEARESTERKVMRMRRIARALALFWASCWTLIIVGGALAFSAIFVALSSFPLSIMDMACCVIPPSALLVSVAWIIALLPRRREAIGGLVLVIVGSLVALAILYFMADQIGVAMKYSRLDTQEGTRDFLAWFVACVILLLVSGAAPLAAGIVFLASWRTSPMLPREELPVLPPKPVRFPDFSPMPEEFADFAQMLEEAKEKSGTLICFECGHYNPVGQSQCEECGAWVPQTARGRWSYVMDK